MEEEKKRRSWSFLPSLLQLVLLPLLSILVLSADVVSAGILDVWSKFACRDRSISDFKAHDSRRQVSLLTVVNLPLAGSGRADGVGCGARQSGDLTSSDEALDGILGFGNSNSSAISQLAASGVVKNLFAHCLDGVNGGGIFAIGHVVQPQVNTTSINPNQKHYSVYMKSV